jgi:hypothetical protein
VAASQQQRPSDSSEAAVSALVAEVRALRADLVESAQRSLFSAPSRPPADAGAAPHVPGPAALGSHGNPDAADVVTAGIARQVRTMESCDGSQDPTLRRDGTLRRGVSAPGGRVTVGLYRPARGKS